MEFVEERFAEVVKQLLGGLNEMIEQLGDLDKQVPMLIRLNKIPMFSKLNMIPMLKKLDKIQISDELQGSYDSALNDAEITFAFYLV